MRTIAALAVSGLALSFVPLPAVAQGTAPFTIVDAGITNTGPLTSACPVALQLLAHVKVVIPTRLSYVWVLADRSAQTQVQTVNALIGPQAVAGTFDLTIKAPPGGGQATRKGTATLYVHTGGPLEVITPAGLPAAGTQTKSVGFTITCPIVTPGSIEASSP